MPNNLDTCLKIHLPHATIISYITPKRYDSARNEKHQHNNHYMKRQDDTTGIFRTWMTNNDTDTIIRTKRYDSIQNETSTD